MLLIVYGSENFIHFNLTAFLVVDLQMMRPIYPDTTIVSPVSDKISGSTALARSLTLKFEF